MKALDILNRLQDEQPMYFENEVTEAIAELESLQEPKSCEGCKWYVPNDKYRNYCDSVNAHICIRYSFNDIEDYYEPKDT